VNFGLAHDVRHIGEIDQNMKAEQKENVQVEVGIEYKNPPTVLVVVGNCGLF
jgi:hypothetical protein